MQHKNDLLHSPQAEKLMGNSAALEQLKDAPETQKIFSKLSKTAGGNLEQAAQHAANGDPSQLMDAIRKLMQDPESAKLIQQMRDRLK